MNFSKEGQSNRQFPNINTHGIALSLLLLLALNLHSSMTAWSNPQVLVLNNTNKEPYTNETHDGYIDLIANEAFRRIGIKLSLIRQPPERGLLNANSGLIDGDLVRIKNMEAIYPNLVRVPEKVMDWEFAAFSKNPKLVSNWQAIYNNPVGHIKGWKIYEMKLAGAKTVTVADDAEQLFRLLLLDRVDTILFEKWLGLAIIKQLNNGITLYNAPLETREMFIYLNNNHAALAPKLAIVLRQLKQEGFYQNAFDTRIAPYLPAPDPHAKTD
jgi:polar amino acid transport system substrate-binding protein